MDSPFSVEVLDKAFSRRGWVGDPISLVVSPRHNRQPTGALTVRSDHRRLPDLADKGARVRIRYEDELTMTGRVTLRQGKGPSSSGTVTFQVTDDWRLFTRVQGWPNPAGTLAQQGDATREDKRTGNMETVARGFIQANVINRLGLPVSMGANSNRGATATVSMRFHPLADRLMPAMDTAGLGATVQQSGAGWVVGFYAPRVYPRTLTEASGVVQEWGWSQSDPTVTRVVGGGEGEAEARVHRQIIDAARESEWGDVIEGFRDARDVRTTETDWQALLDARIQESLDEGAPTAGLSLKLAETSTFRYDPTGTSGVRVGDKVRVEVGPGVVVEDVLREAHLSWTADEGLLVTPVVGERTDDPTRTLARAVASLARSFRDAGRR